MSKYRKSSYYGPMPNTIDFDNLTAQYSNMNINQKPMRKNSNLTAPKRPFLNTDSPVSMSSTASPIESIFSGSDDEFASPISPDIQSISSSFFFTSCDVNRKSTAPTMPENTFGLPLYETNYSESDVLSIHNSSVRKSYSYFIPPESPQLQQQLNSKLKSLIIDAPEPTDNDHFENEADCYSFIMDFIVDYDSKNIVSMISNNSPFQEPQSISKVMENSRPVKPQFNDNNVPHGTVSSKLQQQMRKQASNKLIGNKPRVQTQNYISGRKIAAKQQGYNAQKVASTYQLPRRIPPFSTPTAASHKASTHDVPLISRRSPSPQPFVVASSSFTPYMQSNNAGTAYASAQSLPLHENNNGQKKTLIYRVIMTKNSIVKNVKRISKSRKSMPTYFFKKDADAPPLPRSKSMYTDNEKNQMIISQNIQDALNSFNTPIYGGSAPIQPVSNATSSATQNKQKTLKQKLKRSNHTKSVALTRLSGHYSPLNAPLNRQKFQDGDAQQLQHPLPDLQQMSINTRSIFINDDKAKAHNLYCFDDNRNLESTIDAQNWKNKVNSNAISQNLKIKDSRNFIELTPSSNVVRKNGSESYKIHNTIMNNSAPSIRTQILHQYSGHGNYTTLSNESLSSKNSRKQLLTLAAQTPRTGKNMRIKMPENNNFNPKALGAANMIQSKNITFNSGAGNRKFFYN